MVVTVTDVGLPAAPDEVSVLPVHGTTDRLEVTWSASRDASVDNYDVQYSEGDTGTWRAWDHPSTGTATTITGLESGTTYQVQVAANSDEGTGPWSTPPSSGQTNPDQPPDLSGPTAVEYEEHRTGTVAAYSATDPETEIVAWASLSGTDANDFELSDSGLLTFSQTPNYESPADSNRDNVYEVTVRAWDGSSYGTLDVVVTVTNKDEDGTVTLSSTQPQVGTELEADLTDPDGSVTSVTWAWARSSTSSGPWSTISGATGDVTYLWMLISTNTYELWSLMTMVRGWVRPLRRSHRTRYSQHRL